MNDKSQLVLLTLEYPFGNKETFLESEILYLSAHFDQVYIIPSNSANKQQRNLPANIHLITDLCENNSSYGILKLFSFASIVFNVFLFSFKNSHKPKYYLKHFKSLLHHFYNDIHKLPFLEKIICKNQLQGALYYDYWLLNSSISLIELKKKGVIKKVIARTHRFDLYDEVIFEQLVPFKQYKIKYLDYIFTISKHGEEYLKNQVIDSLKHKIITSYLGVFPSVNQPLKTKKTLIVSCSSMIDFKKVPKIAEAISQINTPCTWLHFGTGPEYDEVVSIAKTFPSHINVELNGFLPNVELLKFYEENYISCFISLSTSEGLPVSMMEVQSFGIPIIAPAINGIPELVNETTGVLLPEDYSIKLVTEALEAIINGSRKFDRNKILSFFESNFNSENNYNSFATQLKTIWGS